MPVRLLVDPAVPARGALQLALEALARGAIVAFPTDTLYGLAVDPRNQEAVRRLYAAKGRVDRQAVPLVAADLEQVERDVGQLPPLGRELARRFWPGPLTLVIRAHPSLVQEIHGGRGAVGVRVPAHVVARQLAAEARCPLTATSANRSGAPPANSGEEVERSLGDAVAVIVDAGPTVGGLPSTIVDVSGDGPVLVRAGVVPWERVLESL